MIGDIVSCTIGNDGWWASIQISGISGSGTYNNGLGINNSIKFPNNPTMVFSVLSSGYNDSGIPITIPRTVYGTTGVRFPYPNNLLLNESINSSNNLAIQIALSDYIYQKDTNITFSGTSGFYTSTGGVTTNNSISGLSVTNGSSHPYPQVIGNWSWVPFERVTNSGTLRCLAFHTSAISGRPVRTVYFSVYDNSGNTVSGYVTGMSIDNRIGGAIPVAEYVWNYSTSSLNSGSLLTGNFIAYPWIGDTGSLLNTSIPNYGQTGSAWPYLPQGLIQQPTVWPMPFVQLCDSSGNYGITVVVVDINNGNNLSGSGIDITSFNTSSPPPSYQTINSGLQGIKDYNKKNRGRNDFGGGILYLQSGNYAWMGGTITLPSTAATYVTLAPFPGVGQSNVIITGQTGTSDFNTNKLQFSGLTLATYSNGGVIIDATFWENQCYHNCSGALTFYNPSYNYITNNTIKGDGNGFKPFSTSYEVFPLVRGNKFLSGFSNTASYGILANTVIGNFADLSNGVSTFITDFSNITQTIPTGNNVIIYSNYFSRSNGNGGGPIVFLRGNQIANNAFTGNGLQNNIVYSQNLLEGISSLETNGLSIASDGTLNDTNNVIIHNNVSVGANRSNLCYNESGQWAPARKDWSWKNNVFNEMYFKTDTFPGEGGPSGIRTGNWAMYYGVGCEGNIVTMSSGTNSTINQIFPGLNTIYPLSGTSLIVYPTGFLDFINPQDFFSVGGKPSFGSGNYGLLSGSPAINMGLKILLPYDISGVARQNYDAGIYAYISGIGFVRRRIFVIS